MNPYSLSVASVLLLLLQDPAPAIRPSPSLGDPPSAGEGADIPLTIEGNPSSITVGVVGDPSPPKTYSPEEIQANGGSVPMPPGATGGQIVYVQMTDPPFTTFLVEVVGTD